ncbi:hypothetical protein ACXR0O_29655 [Verrucomicrobiota bacterium sgz303538]
MKHFSLLIAALVSLPAAGFSQQAVPESPALWREVTGVVNTYPGGVGTTAVPVFTRPHMPAFRTSADGRIACIVEGGGAVGSTPGFTLMMPEKMTVPFVLNAAGSYTMSATTFTRINVTNSYGTVSLGNKNFTDGVKGVSHACIWDPGNNPTVVAGEDVYDIKVFATANTGTSPDNHTQFFVTPVRITVSNPKTASASIRLVEKTGPTIAGPQFTFQGSAFEPVIAGDGRLLIVRVGSPSLPWTDPVTGVARTPQGCDIVYSYYETGAAADPTQWTNLIPITHAPYDTRINIKFGFAMAPFRDGEGTIIPDGEDIGTSYPWIDREAKNLFFESVFDRLHFLSGGTWNNGRYPQTAAPGETADYVQGEDGGKHQGVSVVGLWTHGKIVLIDNLNNGLDYAVGQGDTDTTGGTSTGPQHRLVNLFQANSGPLGNESGWLLLGYGRATKKMPAGENDNGNIIDSLENLFNYRKESFPLTRRDVVWPLSNGQQADELTFDDYIDPDAFIVANMAGLLTFPSSAGSSSGSNSLTHHSGWNTSTNTFSNPVRLQNAATATSDRWIVPKHGLVVGNGRLEPAASGGVHGKGFSMNGNIGLEFTVVAQPQNVTTKDWYAGLFVDCRFAIDTTERRLLTFPDGTSVRLYGRSQVLYADASGAVIHRISLPVPNTAAPTSAMDDLLPDTGWAHLAFQIRDSGTTVEFYLNGIIYNRWDNAYQALFQMVPGKLTVGKVASSTIEGFSGWIDDFKVFAHAMDYESACNHANGSLIGLPSTYTDMWKTKFASRYPSWAHSEISNFLKNNGETTYPLYANFYDYRNDNGAHRDNVPAGTVWLRQSIHFPEGPLFHDRPRPDSETNTFCLTCHHTGANAGLDTAALELDNSWLASADPRRQPSQPPRRLFGRIPAGLVNSTGLPSALTDLGASGKLADEWLLSSFNNSATVQSFTVVDANTRRDLMTLTAGATVDPARLGSTNLTIRANLDRAQGSVTLQYDSGATNLKTKPPFTAFGSDLTPYTGATLTPGAHTIKATPQFGALSSVNFTVAGNSTRVVADYRDDFKPFSPQPGWSYLWNALGPITSPANYRTLAWSPVLSRYSVNGFSASPDNTSTLFPYGNLTSTGGHPGRGTTQSAVYDRFAIAAYTAKLAGYYGINNSFVTGNSTMGNGGQVIIYTETNNGATFTQKFSSLYAAGQTLPFVLNVGYLQAGDTIYVAVGPNTTDGNDSFSLDFSVVFNEAVNPVP